MVASIFHSFDGHPLLKHRPPHLVPKLKFLEQCFAEIPDLAQFRAESVTLFPRFAAAGKKRNELVHGAISEISIEDGAFMFLKVDVTPKEHHSVRSFFLAESEWTVFRKELMALGKDGQSFAQRVWDSLKAIA